MGNYLNEIERLTDVYRDLEGVSGLMSALVCLANDSSVSPQALRLLADKVENLASEVNSITQSIEQKEDASEN